MTVFEGFRQLYCGLRNFILKAWWVLLLVAVPVLSTTSYANGWPIWESPFLTVTWLLLCSVLNLAGIYILFRFFALNGDMKRVVAVTKASIRTFVPFALVWTLHSLLGPALSAFLPQYPAARWAYDVLVGLIAIWLSPWAVSSPSGQQAVTPMASFDAVFPHTVWAIFFLFLAWLPLSVAELVLLAFTPEEHSHGRANFQGVTVLVLISIAKWLIAIGSMYVIAMKAGLQVGTPRGALDGTELA